jgi:hypothetical protein
MKFWKSKRFLGACFVTAILLSACVFPEQDDPFERLPAEETETVIGEIFPFSVSVATRATHRLENEGKLVYYLASNIVRLDDFVGRKVELDGIKRSEKMREIFWVEAIRLKDLDEKSKDEKIENRFKTKRFTFVFPENWEYSTAPDGTTHFTKKDDPARRVFLTFTVEDVSRDDKKNDPNVLISNLAGIKKIETDEMERERQSIILFSNIFDKKYKFVFTANFEEFEKKKDFFRLLNTFIEGEENVLAAVEKDLKNVAEREAEKIKEESKIIGSEEKMLPAVVVSPEERKGILSRMFGEEIPEELLEPEEKTEVPDTIETVVEEKSKPTNLSIAFTNLIDARAFIYESAYYNFSMKVPYGFWFRNFGASENRVAEIGFSDEAFEEKSGAKFFLVIIGDENPPTVFSEKLEGDQLTIEFPRGEKSFFRIYGPSRFRDAMRSVQSTVESF